MKDLIILTFILISLISSSDSSGIRHAHNKISSNTAYLLTKHFSEYDEICGIGSKKNDFKNSPWSVDIIKSSDSKSGESNSLCAGVLVSKLHVLTSALCLIHAQDSSFIKVQIGPNVSEKHKYSVASTHLISSGMPNERTSAFEFPPTVALLTLASPVSFAKTQAVPICLPPFKKKKDPDNKMIKCNVARQDFEDSNMMKELEEMLRNVGNELPLTSDVPEMPLYLTKSSKLNKNNGHSISITLPILESESQKEIYYSTKISKEDEISNFDSLLNVSLLGIDPLLDNENEQSRFSYKNTYLPVSIIEDGIQTVLESKRQNIDIDEIDDLLAVEEDKMFRHKKKYNRNRVNILQHHRLNKRSVENNVIKKDTDAPLFTSSSLSHNVKVQLEKCEQIDGLGLGNSCVKSKFPAVEDLCKVKLGASIACEKMRELKGHKQRYYLKGIVIWNTACEAPSSSGSKSTLYVEVEGILPQLVRFIQEMEEDTKN